MESDGASTWLLFDGPESFEVMREKLAEAE